MRLSRAQKSLALLEQFGFRLLILRFNFCVGSASALQSKAPTWPSEHFTCLARDFFGWNELGLSLCCCSCTWCTLASHHPCLPTEQEPNWGFTAAKVAMGLTWLIVFHEENRAGNVFFPLCLVYCNALHLPQGTHCTTGDWALVQRHSRDMQVSSAWQNRFWKYRNYLLTGHNYRDGQQACLEFSWS